MPDDKKLVVVTKTPPADTTKKVMKSANKIKRINEDGSISFSSKQLSPAEKARIMEKKGSFDPNPKTRYDL